MDNPKEDDRFYQFAKSNKAVAVNRLFFGINIRNPKGSNAVMLRSLRVTDLRCGPPLKGTRIWWGGGGDELHPRLILINLDEQFPEPRYFPRANDLLDMPISEGKPYSFKVREDDSEQLDIVATVTRRRYCTFRLKLVTDGQYRDVIIPETNKPPFGVTGDPDHTYWRWGDVGPRPHWELNGEGVTPQARSSAEPLTATDS